MKFLNKLFCLLSLSITASLASAQVSVYATGDGVGVNANTIAGIVAGVPRVVPIPKPSPATCVALIRLATSVKSGVAQWSACSRIEINAENLKKADAGALTSSITELITTDYQLANILCQPQYKVTKCPEDLNIPATQTQAQTSTLGSGGSGGSSGGGVTPPPPPPDKQYYLRFPPPDITSICSSSMPQVVVQTWDGVAAGANLPPNNVSSVRWKSQATPQYQLCTFQQSLLNLAGAEVPVSQHQYWRCGTGATRTQQILKVCVTEEGITYCKERNCDDREEGHAGWIRQ